jgi:hypothetical protein
MYSKMMIYVTGTHGSISVTTDTGVERQASGRSMRDVIDAMNEDDRIMLATFAQSIVEFTGGVRNAVISINA